jgi:hypothetical protein
MGPPRRLGRAAREDDLAREALRRKAEQEQLAAGYQSQWEAQQTSTDNLKQALRALSEKIDEAARKKNLLVARQKRAEAQKHIHEVMTGLSDTSAFEAFDRMAARVDQVEAQAAATVELTRNSAVKRWSNASEHWRIGRCGAGSPGAESEVRERGCLVPLRGDNERHRDEADLTAEVKHHETGPDQC